MQAPETYESQFDNFDKERLPYRRDILPLWIKIFCWIFMIFGSLAAVNLVLFMFGLYVNASFYGLDEVLPHPFGQLASLLLTVLSGISAFMLWLEHDKALVFGQVVAVIGIAVCILVTLASMFSIGRSLMFRLEIIALIPFFMWLNRMPYVWEYDSRKR